MYVAWAKQSRNFQEIWPIKLGGDQNFVSCPPLIFCTMAPEPSRFQRRFDPFAAPSSIRPPDLPNELLSHISKLPLSGWEVS